MEVTKPTKRRVPFELLVRARSPPHRLLARRGCWVAGAPNAPGVAGAPKLGDAAQWAERIAQGMDVLVRHAIEGYQGSSGFMPAKGARLDLSDEEVADAVDYMVSESS